MASYTLTAGQRGAYSKTLVANTTDSVSFVANDQFSSSVPVVRITNIDGAAPIYVTLDGSDPTVGDGATFELPAIPCKLELTPPHGTTVVKLKSSGTPKYSVSEAY